MTKIVLKTDCRDSNPPIVAALFVLFVCFVCLPPVLAVLGQFCSKIINLRL